MRIALKVAAVAVVGLGFLVLVAMPRRVSGFTQGAVNFGTYIPIGHEQITCLAGIELLDQTKLDKDDPRQDPSWKSLAQNLALNDPRQRSEVDRIKGKKVTPQTDGRYDAKYQFVYDAIMGERWVDIGGLNAIGAKGTEPYDCIDYVTQEPPELQYDHFMRRHDDVNGQGGVTAARESVKRFIRHFVNAAMAKPGNMKVWDGGGFRKEETVDRNYFLFGRAVHVFEDSFSSDHTVRIAEDGYRRVRQVKSYLCAYGSEQHAHTPFKEHHNFYQTGDVIWKSDNDSNYKASNMKPEALAATEGTKELWAAFIRTMATPEGEERRATAEREAKGIVDHWLSFDEAEMRQWYKDPRHRSSPDTYVASSDQKESQWGGTPQQQCMLRDWGGKTQDQKLHEFYVGRQVCIWNMASPLNATEEDKDLNLQIAYLWHWRNAYQWKQPPADFQVGEPVHPHITIELINRSNRAPLRREDKYLYVDNNPKANQTALQLSVTDDVTTPGVGSALHVIDPNHGDWYLGHVQGDGQRYVRIYQPEKPARFRFIRRLDGFYNIRLLDKGKDWSVLHLNDGKPSLAHEANPDRLDAQWYVRGIPEAEVGGTYRLVAPSGKVVTLVNNRLMTRVDEGWKAASASQRFAVERLHGPGGMALAETYGFSSEANKLSLRSNGAGDKGITASNVNDSRGPYGFYIEPRPDGRFQIRNHEDGMYWREKNDAITADVRASGACPNAGGASSGSARRFVNPQGPNIPGMVPAPGVMGPQGPNVPGRVPGPSLVGPQGPSAPGMNPAMERQGTSGPDSDACEDSTGFTFELSW